MQQTFTIKEITENLQIARMRYQLPDTSAYIRYQPELSCDNTNISVQGGMMLPHESCEPAGIFKLAELVNELNFAYLLVHIFPDTDSMNYFVAGFDTGLSQLDFIGGSFDNHRFWLTSGLSNLGVPVVVFYGQRNAVNGQPSVTLVDHRENPAGQVAWRAIRGAGEHVGEEFFV
ncbi:hypothetical protein [Plesiomonas shigelloides]|uniref:hypothetical protein n=1 Tax=Plesiomonas shigelloides TaxID=703 RepID=UPI001261F1A3|nr:hypothetical protein [Plesiomonas shigelloides]KAB7695119.1 hypothetical protein GBN15_13885 [Plesiomonas shigelloides]